MSLANSKSGIQIPDRMRNKLAKFQKKVWIIKLAEGLLAAAFGLLVSYLLVFVLDRFFDTSVFVRAAILIVGAIGLGVWFPLVCHKWIWKSRKLEQVARLLKYKFPRLGDHLLGIIQLVNNEQESHRSEALTRAALAQVDEETKDRDFGDAVPNPKHVRWALIAGVPALIALAALVLVPTAASNSLARWLTPWKDTPRYTFAQIESLPSSIVVPVAETYSLNATLSPETQWSPDSASATVGGANISADQESGQYGFQIPPLKTDSKLRVSIGDIRETVEITPAPRPEISQLLATIKLPDYLERTESLVKDIRGGVVTMVTGSEVNFVGTATRDIEMATADGEALQVNGPEITTAAVSVNESRVVEFQWKDTLGLTSKEPLKLKIRSESDQEPTLACRNLKRQRVLMEKDVLTFEVDASDDFGVKTIGMQWSGEVGEDVNYESAAGDKIVAAGTPESNELSAVATFSPTSLGIRPQAVKLRLSAQDYLPGREPVYSSTYTVFILSEQDHAIWLTRRMDEWFKQSLENYEREQQLFNRNVELRNLSAEELDRPENRNKIEAQAVSERAQARRLEALIERGTKLTKDATRNDQFDVQTLEKLSKMLHALDDIATQRMPSVSAKLKEAADAAAGEIPSNGTSKTKAESLGLMEKSMDKPAAENSVGGGTAGGGGGRSTLPSVLLQDNSAPSNTPGDTPRSVASGKMTAAVAVQEELLVEFQQVAEELKKIIQNLEGSTFVKRLKEMSRLQLELAEDVNQMTVKEFGVSDYSIAKPTKDRSQLLSDRELVHLDTATNIRDDLLAYANRVNESKFKSLLDEMNDDKVIRELSVVSEMIALNESGNSIAHLELLADTFDRWAEQLVDPAPDSGGSGGGSGSSMPPSIVLEVMKILEQEISLREQTRGLHQANPQMDPVKYRQDAISLADAQDKLVQRAAAVGKAILDLENASDFEEESAQIQTARMAMKDAAEVLAKPDTGPAAIAAETEAIESLLEAKRSRGPLTRQGANLDGTALALLGAADEQEARAPQRAVQQSSGKLTKEVPEEFRYGLDQYFEDLEKAK